MFSYLYSDLLEDLAKFYGFFGMGIHILSLLVESELRRRMSTKEENFP
jgi:hypothetical protein